MQINETKKDSKIVNIVIFLFYLVIPPVGCAAVMFFLKGQATDLIFWFALYWALLLSCLGNSLGKP